MQCTLFVTDSLLMSDFFPHLKFRSRITVDYRPLAQRRARLDAPILSVVSGVTMYTKKLTPKTAEKVEKHFAEVPSALCKWSTV